MAAANAGVSVEEMVLRRHYAEITTYRKPVCRCSPPEIDAPSPAVMRELVEKDQEENALFE